ncbi:hypothetical protein Pelo_8209 [Pelomyxa schiedti]|nr:hypothetical protein Pelo_8209 [Pelomyxa schiedti]
MGQASSSQRRPPRGVPAVCIKSQLVAFAASSQARVPIRLGLSLFSPRFLCMVSFAIVVGEPGLSTYPEVDVVSFRISRTLLGVESAGITTAHFRRSDPGLCIWRSLCDPTHVMDQISVCGNREYRVAPLLQPGASGRIIGFGEDVGSWVVVSRWMDWAVATNRELDSLVIVKISPDESCNGRCAAPPSPRRVQVNLPENFRFLRFLFPNCSEGELILVGISLLPGGCTQIWNLELVVVDLLGSFHTKSLVCGSSVLITETEINRRFMMEDRGYTLLLRKQDGSAAFVLLFPWVDLFQVDSSTGHLTHLRSTEMNAASHCVSQLNKSVFCALFSQLNLMCEFWECNNTETPFKTVSFPGCWQVICGSGFLFVVKGAQIQVLDPDSGLIVITITFPPDKKLWIIERDSIL